MFASAKQTVLSTVHKSPDDARLEEILHRLALEHGPLAGRRLRWLPILIAAALVLLITVGLVVDARLRTSRQVAAVRKEAEEATRRGEISQRAAVQRLENDRTDLKQKLAAERQIRADRERFIQALEQREREAEATARQMREERDKLELARLKSETERQQALQSLGQREVELEEVQAARASLKEKLESVRSRLEQLPQIAPFLREELSRLLS